MPEEKKYLIIETKEKTKDRFKRYCRNQGVSMKVGLNSLMRAAAKENFPIRTKMRIKYKEL